MNKEKLIDLLRSDLRNECTHLFFYLHSASMVAGLHREELSEFFLDQAKDEMDHVKAFSDMIIGLGGFPECMPNQYPLDKTNPMDILTYALSMEMQVVENYVERIAQAREIGGVDGEWVEIFLEDQITDSRTDIDHMRKMI